jgi:uncharacterized membrane protein
VLRTSSWKAPTAATAFLFLLYSVLSIRQHQLLLTTGFDLGIFEQIAAEWARGDIPVISLVNDTSLAAHHFGPILALLGPVYAIYPHAETLLVVQAALMAVGVIPLMRWAKEELGDTVAWAVAAVYGLSAGIASAVGFDFHEIAFAVPLLSFSTVRLGQRREVSAVLWALPLVFVKEDLGVTVAAIGMLVIWRGSRLLGAGAIAWGLGWSAAAVFLILPRLEDRGTYYYFTTSSSHGIVDIVRVGITDPDIKIFTLVVLLGPTLFAAARSPLLLLIVPTLAWRFTTDREALWLPGFHYDAVLVPIVVAAFVDGLTRMGERRPKLALPAAITMTLILLPVFDLGRLAIPRFWQESARVDAAHKLLDRIPDGSRVAATNDLVPQLTDRATVFEFGTEGEVKSMFQPNDWESADWIIVDTKAASQFDGGNDAGFDDQLKRGFTLIGESHGFRLARRGTAGTN